MVPDEKPKSTGIKSGSTFKPLSLSATLPFICTTFAEKTINGKI